MAKAERRKSDSGKKEERRYSIMRRFLSSFKHLLVATVSVFSVVAASAAPGTSILKNSEHNFQLEYPSDWKSHLNKKTNVIGIYGLPLLNYDQLKGTSTETRVYVLRNEPKKSLDDFFLSGKLKSKEFISRNKRSYNDLEVLLVGYEYDPPQWKIIKYEIEAMVKISEDVFVYIQIAGVKSLAGNELKKIVESILSSFRVL
jgi:hypothetical protein